MEREMVITEKGCGSIKSYTSQNTPGREEKQIKMCCGRKILTDQKNLPPAFPEGNTQGNTTETTGKDGEGMLGF